ncbi:phage tail length tape measure family protein [Novosphingobium sp. SG707]|uniref:phage tail length tape measure family protein n=1 Tax=Novosphingobium sp. SG707 TaxID=2586996 RepID=UPI0014453573|nr:phage tail length tape measure family protein [Novosphingobium sp. SG707]NKI99583.1 hypothetical protein [Novosphingobium sp. SG707]
MAVKPLVLVLDGQTDKLKAALRSAATDVADTSKSIGEVLEGIQEKVRNSLNDAGVDAGEQIGRNISRQVKEWQRAASSATASGGNFDPLGGLTSASILERAAAQDRLAASLREQAAAAEKAEGANTREAMALRQVGISAGIAAMDADREAASLRSQASVLAAMEQAMGRHTNAQRQIQQVSGATRNAMRDLSFQVSDVATSLAGGMPAAMVFSQQFGQIVGAFQMMEGEGNKLISFLSGPWGMALSTAAVAIVPLVAHLDMFQDKVGDAAKKLKEQAENTRIADQAQAIFDHTLDGAIARERKLSEELERQLKTRRELNQEQLNANQQSQSNLANQVSAARRDLQAAQAAQRAANQMPGNGEAARASRDAAIAAADRRAEDARNRLFNAQQSEKNAERDVRAARFVQIEQAAKDNASPEAKKLAALDLQRQNLKNRFINGGTNEADAQAQLTAIDQASDAAKKKPKKAKDTTARDAEAEKKSDAAYDEAYSRSLSDLANIARQNVTDLEELGRLDKVAVDMARKRERRATEEQGRREKWSRADIDALQYKQGEVAEAKKAQIDERTKRDIADRWIEVQRSALSMETQLLQAQSALALTVAERRTLALQILENERKQAILAVDKKVTDGQLTGEQGMAEIGNINQTFDLRRTRAEQQNAGPMASYKQQLRASTADMNASLESVQVNGLKGLEDGLVGLVSGTETAASAFKRMAASIIADLARIAIEQAFVKVLGFGLASGGKVTARASGGLLGYAAGGTRLGSGMISGPGSGTSDSILALVNGRDPVLVSNGEGIVNERAVRNYWPMIDAMNKGTFPKFANGGLLSAATATLAYPRIPSARSLAPMGQTVNQYFSIDAKGAILANELMDNMAQISAQHASAALAAAPGLTQQQMQQRAEQRIPG